MRLSSRFKPIIALFLIVASACGGSSEESTATSSPVSDSSATTSSVDSNETTTSAQNAGIETTVARADFEELIGDLPKPCEFITAEEMGAILGNEVTSEESFGSDCFYTSVEGAETSIDVHTSALAFSQEECEFLLQTEPIFDGESVESVGDYDGPASLITSEGSAELQVCSAKAAITVYVSGGESSELVGAAREIVNQFLQDL